MSRVQDNISATLNPVASALQATPIMGAPPPPWVRPDILNGFSQTASPQPVCAFHLDALDYVHVKLALTHAAGTAAGTSAFILPLGFRPLETLTFMGTDATGVSTSVTVDNAGNVANFNLMAAGDQILASFIFLAEA